MDRSRRRVLALTSSLTLPALAGCFGFGEDDSGGGSGSGTDSDSGGSNDGGGGDGGSGNETAETTTETATPEPQDSEFVRTTREIMNQIRWFAVDYPRARRQFLTELRPVVETLQSLEQQNTLTESDVATLRERTTTFAAFNQEVMASHFELDDRLVVGDNFMVKNFERAVEREDAADQRETLNRLAVFYERLANDAYLALNLSAHPIRDPLHSTLIAGDTRMIFGISYPQGDNFKTQTFSKEYQDLELLREGRFEEVVRPHSHQFPTGQEVYDHAHEYDAGHDIYDHGYGEDADDDEESEPPGGRLYAFSEGGVDILKDEELWRDRMADYSPEFTNVFDAVVNREGRVDYAYVMANRLVTEPLDSQQFTGRPVFLQRYESADAAAAAVEELFATTIREEGTTTLAGREWRQVFYDYDGPNLYANLVQVEEFLIAAAVSSEPHNRRDEQWDDDYTASWLGLEESSGESDDGDAN